MEWSLKDSKDTVRTSTVYHLHRQNSDPCSSLVSLVSVGVSVWCFGNRSICSVSGVLLVSLCGALVTVVPTVSLMSLHAVSLVSLLRVHADDKEQAMYWKEKKIEALSKEREIRDNQVEALARMETVLAQMKDCLTVQNMAEVALLECRGE